MRHSKPLLRVVDAAFIMTDPLCYHRKLDYRGIRLIPIGLVPIPKSYDPGTCCASYREEMISFPGAPEKS